MNGRARVRGAVMSSERIPRVVGAAFWACLVACASPESVRVNAPSSSPPAADPSEAASAPQAPPASSGSLPAPPAPHDAPTPEGPAQAQAPQAQTLQGAFHSAANQAYCIDAAEGRSARTTPVRLLLCHGGESQRWILSPDPSAQTTIVGIGGLCLGLHGSPPGPGARAHLDPCTDAEGQAWTFDENGRVREVKSGKCLTITKAARGTPIHAEKCESGNPGQVWTLTAP